MNETSLRVFAAICDTGSFTKAANEMFITQPAVSRHIQALEHHYGVELFERQGRTVSLTANGEILRAKTRELFSLHDELEGLFDDIVELRRGRITIAASATMASYLLPDAIISFRQLYPGIQIEMLAGNTHEVNRLVEEGLADMGFAGSAGMDRRRLSKTIVHKDPLVMVAAAKDTLCGQDNLRPHDMVDHTFVWREKGTQTRLYARSLFKNTKMNESGMMVGRIETAKKFAARSGYITALPEITVKQEISDGILARLNVVGFKYTVHFDVVINAARRPSMAAQSFLQHLSKRNELSHACGLKKMLELYD
ncbi:LysR family transcriptional regulator [Salidesulfovibrio onnuriiensis]|uniref:LysR family transcriptional regulator n=1 Tax=Salidesulfovibrio onnuriiensis TaxID=2583823 RepID=UPI0011C904ED|nr:LysR family transcriptional regulator [Salidesulfovibrio onnuriiensis]